jgi:hypothetical protein
LKRFLGFVVVILAIMGGLHAVGSALNNPKAGLNQTQQLEEAEGFASGYIKAYLTLPADPNALKSFSDLQDDRPIQTPDLVQSVLGVWPLGSEQDPTTRAVHVDLLVQTKTDSKSVVNNHEQENVSVRYWRAHVQVSRDEAGKLNVLKYPSLHPFIKGAAWLPKMDSQDDSAAKSMTPMLESFFKTYLSAEKTEDMANYFSTESMGQGIQPLNDQLLFDSVEKVEAYGKGPWLVWVTLHVKDPVTNTMVRESYQLQVIKNQEKYLIQTFQQ